MEGYMGTILTAVMAVLFIVLGVPLVLKKVRPNYYYGARVSRYVFEDEEIWYTVNRGCGIHFTTTGVILLVYAAATTPFLGNEAAQAKISMFAFITSGILLALSAIWGARKANRMALEKGLKN